MKVKVTLEFEFKQEDEEGKEEDLVLTPEEIEDFKALIENLFENNDETAGAVSDFLEEIDGLKDKSFPNWEFEVE